MGGTNSFEVIEIPWQPGTYARRILVEKLDRAGRPPINSAGRLKAEQQKAWDAFQAGTGSPADDPNRPDRDPLAHVRFAAADITPTPTRVAALAAEGLIRPYKHEPWHWELPNVRQYPLVDSIPAPQKEEEDSDMPKLIKFDKGVMPNDPTFKLAPGFLYCHQDAEEQRVDRHVYGDAILSLSAEDFYRLVKSSGLIGALGPWGSKPASWPLPKPGKAYIEPAGTKG